MSHVIGFSNKEGVGSAGIELKYNSYLKGKEGHRSSKKDGRNREIYTARELDIPPQDGANIILTLDQQIQYIAEKSIENIYIDYGTKSACAIVQDVELARFWQWLRSLTLILTDMGKHRQNGCVIKQYLGTLILVRQLKQLSLLRQLI